MKNTFLLLGGLALLLSACDQPTVQSTSNREGAQSEIIRNLIAAVNAKDAEKYVEGFAEQVQIYVDTLLRIEGRNRLKDNRAKHFQQHPQVRSEIQHLVEIDNKVIMHDKVWFDTSDPIGKDIVE
ncbi:MAG: nuclear transport factor 2 family protein, partial [Bacteroidota bacterium]